MTYLDRAIKDGYAIITGPENKQKIIYVTSDNHTENYNDPEEKVRAEFWAELIYEYDYPAHRITPSTMKSLNCRIHTRDTSVQQRMNTLPRLARLLHPDLIVLVQKLSSHTRQSTTITHKEHLLRWML